MMTQFTLKLMTALLAIAMSAVLFQASASALMAEQGDADALTVNTPSAIQTVAQLFGGDGDDSVPDCADDPELDPNAPPPPPGIDFCTPPNEDTDAAEG